METECVKCVCKYSLKKLEQMGWCIYGIYETQGYVSFCSCKKSVIAYRNYRYICSKKYDLPNIITKIFFYWCHEKNNGNISELIIRKKKTSWKKIGAAPGNRKEIQIFEQLPWHYGIRN